MYTLQFDQITEENCRNKKIVQMYRHDIWEKDAFTPLFLSIFSPTQRPNLWYFSAGGAPVWRHAKRQPRGVAFVKRVLSSVIASSSFYLKVAKP